MTVDETLELLEKAEFPLKLRFRRLSSLARENDTSSSPKLSLSPSSIDVRCVFDASLIIRLLCAKGTDFNWGYLDFTASS